jgi:hypothetical protein
MGLAMSNLKMKMLKIGLLALFSLAFACGEPDSGAVCENSTTRVCSCENGGSSTQTCVEGSWGACVCEQGCVSNADCGSDQACVDGMCMVAQDTDEDGLTDPDDNCPDIANPDQVDTDGDGTGDACEPDTDGDGVPDDIDNCPEISNANQNDLNGDGIGDRCDSDGDGVLDVDDNCPTLGNPDQTDTDSDEIGNRCDLDDDDDGIEDEVDNCPFAPNSDQSDADEDGVGDACQDDADSDGVLNADDNCPLVPNNNQLDIDGDGIGDLCDDGDGDGIIDQEDNCPTEPNPAQEVIDTDGDGLRDCQERTAGTDPTEPDSDGDSLDDFLELTRGLDPTMADTDGDSLSDGDELAWGLDGRVADSRGDGLNDALRPFVAPCLSFTAPSTDTHFNGLGDFTFAGPVGLVGSAQDVAIAGATSANFRGLSFFENTTGEAFFVATLERPTNFVPEEHLGEYFGDTRLRRLVDHEGHRAAVAELTLDGVARNIREWAQIALNRSLVGLAAPGTYVIPPSGTGAPTVTRARVRFVAIDRGDSVLILGGASSAASLEQLRTVVMPSTVARGDRSVRAQCHPWEARASLPVIDVVWTFSNGDLEKASEFRPHLTPTVAAFDALGDARHIINRRICNESNLVNGWTQDSTELVADLDRVIDGTYRPSAYASVKSCFEYIEMAGAAQQFRPQAEIVSFFSNDTDGDFGEDQPGGPNWNRRMSDYVNFFSARTSFFSMLGDPGRCTGQETYGPDYLTFETGGERAVRCDPMDEVAEQFVEFVAAKTSPYGIYFPVIPSSTTAAVAGQPVSWGEDGWGTRDGSTGVFFLGSSVPQPTSTGQGETAHIVYSTWN